MVMRVDKPGGSMNFPIFPTDSGLPQIGFPVHLRYPAAFRVQCARDQRLVETARLPGL